MINVYLKKYLIIFIILKFSKSYLTQSQNSNNNINRPIHYKKDIYSNNNSQPNQKDIIQILDRLIFSFKYNNLNFLYNSFNNSNDKLNNSTESESWFERNKKTFFIILGLIIIVIIVIVILIYIIIQVPKKYNNLIYQINNISFKKDRNKEREKSIESEDCNFLA